MASFLSVCLLFLSVCTAVKHCDPPADPTIGSFKPLKDAYGYREVIQFSCPDPFTLNGSKSLLCSETGVFQPAAPNCVEVECMEPVVEFGHWESGSRGPYTYKATVTFKCNEGYTMINSATIICGINSRWEPELPKCEQVECKEPFVEFGHWESGSRGPYTYKATVTFKSNEGYRMTNSATIICGINSQWGPELPKCEEVECKEPVVEFGHWDSGSRGPYTHKATVTFKCNEGYTMINSATIICGINSRWEPELPKCEVVPAVQTTTTKSPESTKKPTVKHCDPPVDPTIGSFSPVKETYEYREVIQFSCPEPFTLNGSKSLSCSETGVFQPAAPKCVEVECKEPVVGFGHWESGSQGPYTHKATVTFKCNEGYRMTNSATIICGINSRWEPELPKCERPGPTGDA